MSNSIICNFQMFDKTQTLTIIQKGGVVVQAHVDTADLGQEIANYCERYNAREVVLHGNGTYLVKTAQDIKEAEKFKYGSDTIDVLIRPTFGGKQ